MIAAKPRLKRSTWPTCSTSLRFFASREQRVGLRQRARRSASRSARAGRPRCSRARSRSAGRSAPRSRPRRPGRRPAGGRRRTACRGNLAAREASASTTATSSAPSQRGELLGVVAAHVPGADDRDADLCDLHFSVEPRFARRPGLEALVQPPVLLGHLQHPLLDERVHAARIGGLVARCRKIVPRRLRSAARSRRRAACASRRARTAAPPSRAICDSPVTVAAGTPKNGTKIVRLRPVVEVRQVVEAPEPRDRRQPGASRRPGARTSRVAEARAAAPYRSALEHGSFCRAYIDRHRYLERQARSAASRPTKCGANRITGLPVERAQVLEALERTRRSMRSRGDHHSSRGRRSCGRRRGSARARAARARPAPSAGKHFSRLMRVTLPALGDQPERERADGVADAGECALRAGNAAATHEREDDPAHGGSWRRRRAAGACSGCSPRGTARAFAHQRLDARG